jgi:hypothetical protein
LENGLNYLNEKNILSEGLINNIVNYLLKGKKQYVKDQIKKMKMEKINKSGILKDIDALNKNTEKLEKSFEALFGNKIENPRYSLSDFIKMED